MAQYKSVIVTLKVKESAIGGATAKRLFPTQEHEYVEHYDNFQSLKACQDTLVAGMMEQLVVSQSTTSYFDRETGVRVKVAYSIKAEIDGSISASGVSKARGAEAIANGRTRGKKLSRNARKRAMRAAAKN